MNVTKKTMHLDFTLLIDAFNLFKLFSGLFTASISISSVLCHHRPVRGNSRRRKVTANKSTNHNYY
jgi:hypothetical protein